MGLVRPAAVAGVFYPAEPESLTRELRGYLDAAPASAAAPPKAIIAPHAGTIYSGPIAARIYARLAAARRDISRVVLIGPSHRVPFRGLAVSSAEAFDTPLGRIPLDRETIARLLNLPGVGTLDAAHAQEHSLEVHLPFLQLVLDRFTLVPLVTGDAAAELVASVLDAAWGGPETLVVVSSDLSHYLPYDDARHLDEVTRRAIEHLDSGALFNDQACGRIPIGGLLTVAKRRGLAVETVDLRNSGDTAGTRDRVVGYGAWAFTTPEAGPAAADHAAELRRLAPTLLEIAWSAIESMATSGRRIPEPTELPAPLRAEGACFVCLSRNGELRGCIGSPVAWRPLASDVVDNAIGAAFRDPRFPPLTAVELDGLELSVSVLTPPQTMHFADEAELLAQLRPQIDGLIIEDGDARALFLPSVWRQLPDRRDFLDHLKRKAGLPAGHWSATFSAQRFSSIELKKS